MRYLMFGILCLSLLACGNEEADNPVDPDENPVVVDPQLPEVDPEFLVEAGGDTVMNLPNQFPIPNGWINDYDRLFTEEERNKLAALIDIHHKATGNEIFLVTAAGIEPYPSVSDYTVALGNAWNTSQDTSINNVLIVVSMAHQEIRMESADAWDSRFSDDKSAVVIFDVMLPSYAAGSYFRGTKNGIEEIIAYFDVLHAARLERHPTDSISGEG